MNMGQVLTLSKQPGSRLSTSPQLCLAQICHGSGLSEGDDNAIILQLWGLRSTSIAWNDPVHLHNINVNSFSITSYTVPALMELSIET